MIYVVTILVSAISEYVICSYNENIYRFFLAEKNVKQGFVFFINNIKHTVLSSFILMREKINYFNYIKIDSN